MSSPDRTPVRPLPEQQTPLPRAFAQGTGVMLQSVGVLFFVSTCCVCSLSGLWDPALAPAEVLPLLHELDTQQQTRIADMIQQPAKTGVMLTVMGTTVGGLAMAVFGLGLQSEKPRAACAAMITTLLLLLLLLIAGVGLWTGAASMAARLWHLVLFMLTLVMTGFCAAALKQVIANPPPAEPDNHRDLPFDA